MRISDLSIEELIKLYNEKKTQADHLTVDMKQIKDKVKQLLEESDETKVDCDYGIARRVHQVKNMFSQKKAKEFLTDNEIKECTTQTEVSFVTIMSQESAKAQKMAMEMSK
jgi:hypothetical protein